MILRADKRFTHGFMVMSSYTWSHMRERVTPLNPWEEPEDRVAAVDRPHRITFASVAELPVGRERRWGTDWSSGVDAILGGWQFSAKFEWQVGQPLVFNNNTYFDPACGDPKELKAKWGTESDGAFRGVDVPVMDVSCFYTFQNQPFTQRGGQPVTFQATENPAWAVEHAHVSDHVAGCAVHEPPSARLRVDEEFRGRQTRARAAENRSVERDQLHAVQLGQRDADAEQATFMS